MKPNFNPDTPPSLKFPSQAAMQNTIETIATARAKLLEASLYEAMLRHIGYMPEPEQFKKRAHCVIMPDGTHCYSWDGVEFYRNKITMQFASRPMKLKDPWLQKPRKTPYTAAGIKRIPCVRCGAPSVHQWQVCADDNVFRTLCLDCDIALNELVLRWAGDPNWREKCKRYELEERRHADTDQ